MPVTSLGVPAGAGTIKAAAASGTSGGFTPVANHGYIVVACLTTNQSGVAASTVAWASGGNGSWTKLASFNFNQFQPTIEIWYVNVTSAPGTSTISVTGNAFVSAVYASITEITGHATAQTGGASATSVSSPFNTVTVTPNITGSLLFHGAHDNNEGPTLSANAASTILDQWNNSGADSYSLISSSNTTASTPVTLGVTNTLTANIQLVLEIVPGAGGTNYSQTITDDTGLTDQDAAQSVSYSDTITDDAGSTDVLGQAASVVQSVTDSAGSTDTLTQAAAYVLSVIEQTGSTDTVVQSATAQRVVVDQAGTTDQVTQSGGAVRDITIELGPVVAGTIDPGPAVLGTVEAGPVVLTTS